MLKKNILLILFMILINSSYVVAFVCGNNVCDITETYYTCKQDCPSGSKDNYCDEVRDNKCDPDCYQEDPDCPDYKQTKIRIKDYQETQLFSTKTILTLIMFAIIVLVVFIIFLKVSKQKGKSYLARREPEKTQQFTKTPTQKQDPFDRYRYMFRK